jgi:hypothetical protein
MNSKKELWVLLASFVLPIALFAQWVISLNLVLAGLRLGLKNRQVGEKWVSDDCSYLCKGLTVLIKIKKSWCLTNNIMTIEQVSDTLLLNR